MRPSVTLRLGAAIAAATFAPLPVAVAQDADEGVAQDADEGVAQDGDEGEEGTAEPDDPTFQDPEGDELPEDEDHVPVEGPPDVETPITDDETDPYAEDDPAEPQPPSAPPALTEPAAEPDTGSPAPESPGAVDVPAGAQAPASTAPDRPKSARTREGRTRRGARPKAPTARKPEAARQRRQPSSDQSPPRLGVAPGARAVPAQQPRTRPTRSRLARPRGDVYVVRPGDTLWSIAARHLDNGASAAEIAAEVQRLWNINAAVIGTGSPDTILPGQRLALS